MFFVNQVYPCLSYNDDPISILEVSSIMSFTAPDIVFSPFITDNNTPIVPCT